MCVETEELAQGAGAGLTSDAVILSSEDGSRIFTKYYTPPHQAASNQAGAGMIGARTNPSSQL